MTINRDIIRIGFQLLLERLYEEKKDKTKLVEDVFGFEDYLSQKQQINNKDYQDG